MFLIDKQEEKEIDELLCGAVYRAYAPLRVRARAVPRGVRHLHGWAKRFISHPVLQAEAPGAGKTLHMKIC